MPHTPKFSVPASYPSSAMSSCSSPENCKYCQQQMKPFSRSLSIPTEGPMCWPVCDLPMVTISDFSPIDEYPSSLSNVVTLEDIARYKTTISKNDSFLNANSWSSSLHDMDGWSCTNSTIATGETSGSSSLDDPISEMEDNNNFINVIEDKSQPYRRSQSLSKPSGWRKVRNVVQWTPFIQTYKNRKYQWVQLAGHSGNFKAGKDQGTVLKKLCVQESQCYEKFLHDSLKDFVPEFRGMLTLADDEKFIQLQDCLSSFKSPSIMDCKIGVRTYLEEELAKAKEKPKLRKDMYEKMIAVDVQAPTEEEHKLKGVTKPRYMVWRETISSTATLGFRIEGVKKSDGTSKKDFKTTKTREQVAEAFLSFIGGSWETGMLYLERLKKIRQALDKSEFFKNHELIGSSLLFVHDDDKASIWMIDFGKTVQIPESLSIDHKSPWEVGNHEDGYLIGMDNLINIFERLFTHSNLPTTSSKSPNPVPLSSPQQQEDVVVECLQKSFSEFSIPTLSPSSSSNHSNC
ncbi:inositol-trisphosphate 3-kinase A isoform X2 [Lepeophtheirus salmonis]|uniref:inositol-trisphosphate 3-kinase A isoform X2 n=1 Tax=Lepeophtheirus salmonis TaxID=72036 RepID=UPI003AF3AD18